MARRNFGVTYYVNCSVCDRAIGFMGFPKHVAKEKKLHGDDIYRKLRADKCPLKTAQIVKEAKAIILKNHRLEKYT
jgi:hypothetical protein